jgi:hypothetical protein
VIVVVPGPVAGGVTTDEQAFAIVVVVVVLTVFTMVWTVVVSQPTGC